MSVSLSNPSCTKCHCPVFFPAQNVFVTVQSFSPHKMSLSNLSSCRKCHCSVFLPAQNAIVKSFFLYKMSLSSLSFCTKCHCPVFPSAPNVTVQSFFVHKMSLYSLSSCTQCHCPVFLRAQNVPVTDQSFFLHKVPVSLSQSLFCQRLFSRAQNISVILFIFCTVFMLVSPSFLHKMSASVSLSFCTKC